MSVWVEGQVYLGLFDAWDALQLSPQQLAVSRDGRNFVHVCDGVPAVELGPPGSWDAGWISPVNLPVQVGDELWLYYSGGPVSIGPLHDWIDLPMETGLATIRRDGWVSLEVAEGKDSGWFDHDSSWPGTHSSLDLDVNAEGLTGDSGRIARSNSSTEKKWWQPAPSWTKMEWRSRCGGPRVGSSGFQHSGTREAPLPAFRPSTPLRFHLQMNSAVGWFE